MSRYFFALLVVLLFSIPLVHSRAINPVRQYQYKEIHRTNKEQNNHRHFENAAVQRAAGASRKIIQMPSLIEEPMPKDYPMPKGALYTTSDEAA